MFSAPLNPFFYRLSSHKDDWLAQSHFALCGSDDLVSEAALDDNQNGLLEVVVADGAVSVFFKLFDYVKPHLSILPNTGATVAKVLKLFLQDLLELTQSEFAFATHIDQVERLSNLGLVRTQLVCSHSIHIRLEVDIVIVVGFHELEHALPFSFRKAHVPVIIRQTPKHVHFGEHAIAAHIYLSEDFC